MIIGRIKFYSLSDFKKLDKMNFSEIETDLNSFTIKYHIIIVIIVHENENVEIIIYHKL